MKTSYFKGYTLGYTCSLGISLHCFFFNKPKKITFALEKPFWINPYSFIYILSANYEQNKDLKIFEQIWDLFFAVKFWECAFSFNYLIFFLQMGIVPIEDLKISNNPGHQTISTSTRKIVSRGVWDVLNTMTVNITN